MIYLDNAATTKIDPEVLDAMMPYLTEEYGNPGGIYSLGRRAKSAIEIARGQVANLISARADQIVFTSGGSEANNLAIKSCLGVVADDKDFVTDSTEHDSVLKSVEYIDVFRKAAKFVPVNSQGRIEIREFCDTITEDTEMVSVMCMNNETGVRNPVEEIGKICLDKGILFHTDCVQAAGCCELDVKKFNCDFMSLSSHKIHGPKGVGALYVRRKDLCTPLIDGGEFQEFGLRGGTENVAGIVGFGKACELVMRDFEKNNSHILEIKERFYNSLLDELGSRELTDIIHVNGDPFSDGGKAVNIRFDNVDAQTLLLMLDHYGVCASAGSACTSHSNLPSHVLMAMGLTPDQARSSVRFSFSRMNTEEDVVKAVGIIATCVDNLVK